MPQSFSQFIQEEDSAPHANEKGKVHSFHQKQHDHHADQRAQGKHKSYKTLERGVIYQTTSGTWVGKRNNGDKPEYFQSKGQAEHWVNGTAPKNGNSGFLPGDSKAHKDDSKSYEHDKDVPPQFQHPPSSSESETASTKEKKTTTKEKPKKTEHDKAQSALDAVDGGSSQEDPEVAEARKVDREKWDNVTTMTTDRAKELTAEGYGAGQLVSMAGEVMTCQSLDMYKNGASREEIRNKLMNTIDSTPGHILDSKSGREWVDAAISCGDAVVKKYGLNNIKEIAWDSVEGNFLVGTSGHGTAADMFVKLNNGKRVGISLKKDGKVRIHNGGYDKVMKNIVENMRERGVDEKIITKMAESTDTNLYWNDINETLSDKNLQNLSKAAQSTVDKILKDPDGDLAKEVLGTSKTLSKYTSLLKPDKNGVPLFLSNVQSKLSPEGRARHEKAAAKAKAEGTKIPREGPNENDLKVLSRVAAYLEKQGKGGTVYSDLRDADTKHFSRFIKTMKSDPKLETAMKDEILGGMELEQILGLEKNPALDELGIFYGIPPKGAELSEKSLMKMFGKDSKNLLEDKSFVEQFRKMKDSKEKTKAKEEFLNNVKSKIAIDYSDGEKVGTIKFIGDIDGKKTEFPLFTMGVRTKGIGVSPGFEMVQTSFMGNALEHGFEIDEWPEETRKKWWNGEMSRIDKDLQSIDETSPRSKDLISYKEHLTDRIKTFKEHYKSVAHGIHEVIQTTNT